jgi:hypothetical protein
LNAFHTSTILLVVTSFSFVMRTFRVFDESLVALLVRAAKAREQASGNAAGHQGQGAESFRFYSPTCSTLVAAAACPPASYQQHGELRASCRGVC